MITDWLTILRDIGNAIYDTFVLPGEYVLAQFAAHAPVVASSLGIGGDDNSVILPAVLSLLLWFLLAAVVWKFLRIWQNVARIVAATIRTNSFRVSQAIHGVKTMLVCKIRQLFPRQGTNSTNTISEVEFDDLDMAVLRAAATLGPDFATSAPELADRMTMRPAQVQRSLDKLSKMKMLDFVIGSTDGFDNYRLTQSGAAFVTLWQRKLSGS